MDWYRLGYCGLRRLRHEFQVPLEMLKRTSDAQENLRKQFEAHHCERSRRLQHSELARVPTPAPMLVKS
jgi:hypothetical protein